MAFFPLVAIWLGVSSNKPKVKFMHIYNEIKHNRKQFYYLTRTKHDCTSVRCVFKWNTLVTGNKQGRVGFPQLKQLPRSTENFSVNTTM